MKKSKLRNFFITLIICFLFAPPRASASLLINEFSSSTTDDWIEIYNSGDETLDLTLYVIKDSTENNTLNLTGSVSGKSIATFDWYNKLNKAGDSIRILKKDDLGNPIETVAFGNQGVIPAPFDGQSVGRRRDGEEEFVVFQPPSRGSPNVPESFIATPTPTSEPTQTPTKTPTPSKTPTPTKIPTPTKTPKPISTISQRTVTNALTPTRKTSNNLVQAKSTNSPETSYNSDSGIQNPTAVLGVTDEESILSPTPVVLVKDEKTSFGSFMLIIGSVVCIASGIILFLINKRKRFLQ